MRRLVLLTSLFAFSALACPDLTATYAVCRSKNNVMIESTDLRISQTAEAGVTRYQISFLADGSTSREAYELVANGIPVRENWTSETGDTFESTTTVSCAGGVLILDSVILSNGRNWKTDHGRIRRQGNTLVQEAEGVVGELPFTDVLTCR